MLQILRLAIAVFLCNAQISTKTFKPLGIGKPKQALPPLYQRPEQSPRPSHDSPKASPPKQSTSPSRRTRFSMVKSESKGDKYKVGSPDKKKPSANMQQRRMSRSVYTSGRTLVVSIC